MPRYRPLPLRWGGPATSIADYGGLVRHVHIKDYEDVGHRRRLDRDDEDLEEALKRGVFCPFGEGDVDIAAVVDALHALDYRGWVVVEQDQALGTNDTPESVIAGQRFNLEYLRRLGI